MTHWIFLRHGESTANVGGWLSGWQEVPLTERGRAQAAAAGVALREAALGRCLVSDAQRTLDTAALALEARGGPPLPTHVVADLRERHMGVLQREPWDLVKADGRHARWLAPWDVGPPGGESHADAVGRVCAALRRWDDGTPTLVVTHGSILRGLFAVLYGGTPGARPPVGNCEILRWSGPIVASP